MEGKKRRIVVLGGSFNPPTLAHYSLMEQALNALEAEIGIFVPVSDAYLKRKMRHSHPPVVLSPELRVRMLHAMCTDDRMTVSEIEIGTIAARTVDTMQELQELYPDAELYFVMGADKLSLLVHLTEKKDFLNMFNVILYSREDVELETILKSNEVLSHFLERIVVLPQPDGIETISSSLIRNRMLSGESSQDLLCSGVWELFKGFTPADFPDMVNKFKGEYDYLNNRFSCRFTWQGVEYRTAEVAFQSSKCADEAGRKVYANCSVNKAILLGKDQMPYPGWEDARLNIMESILKAKFGQNPNLMKRLKDTGNRILINGTKQDAFWGVDLYKWQGENHLGEKLMRIRDKGI